MVIPNSVTNIKQYSFYKCTGLKEVTLPNNLKIIDHNVFNTCTSLDTIVIPNSVTSIETNAFVNCKNLTTISMTDNLNSIGTNAFINCESLTSITVPDNVKSIGSGAFNNCTELTIVTLPANLTTIGGPIIFKNTPKLNTILVRSTDMDFNTEIKNYAPWGAGSGHTTTKYFGQYVSFEHNVENAERKYAKNINIKATINEGSVIRNIYAPKHDTGFTGPDYTVGTNIWPMKTFEVDTPGTYIFTGIDDNAFEILYDVVVGPIGQPTLIAHNVIIPVDDAPKLKMVDILAKTEANATTEEFGSDFTDATTGRGSYYISPQDIAKVNALHYDTQTVNIDIIATSGTGLTDTKTVTIEASQDAPITHTVNFYLSKDDMNIGGANYITTQQVKTGENAVAPASPMQDGFRFKQWIGDYENIVEDTNIYAEFDQEFTIQFLDEDTILQETHQITGEEIIEPEPPKKEEYIFSGWSPAFILGTKVEASDITYTATYKAIIPVPTPSPSPTPTPTPAPTLAPTPEPSLEPSLEPTPEPSLEPTPEPSLEPTPEPSLEPTPEPSLAPTPEPTLEPTPEPESESIVIEPDGSVTIDKTPDNNISDIIIDGKPISEYDVSVDNTGEIVINPDFWVDFDDGIYDIVLEYTDAEPKEYTIIVEDGVPTSISPKSNPIYSLFDLIAFLVTLGLMLRYIITYFTNKKRSDEVRTSQDTHTKRRKVWSAILIVSSIVNVLLFIFTQDITRTMKLFDNWSLAFAIILVVQCLSVILIGKKEKPENEIESV